MYLSENLSYLYARFKVKPRLPNKSCSLNEFQDKMISQYLNCIVLLRIRSISVQAGDLYSPPGYGNNVIFRANIETDDKVH